MVSVKDVCSCIEEFAPLSCQESWDNCGLLVGNPGQTVGKVLLTVDVTEAVVAEAVDVQAQMIVSHHPLILPGIKQLTGSTDVQRAIMLAVKKDIAVYAAHTSMDVAPGGVSYRMAEKLGLGNLQALLPQGSGLQKLVTCIPASHFEQVRQAIFEAGAGHIGNYDSCGYSVEGNGTFRALDGAHPFVGRHGTLHTERELRFETVFPSRLNEQIVAALINSHPYEEPAFDIYALQNTDTRAGLGVTGMLPGPVSELHFLKKLKETFLAPVVRHTNLRDKEILRVALCGGSGSSLLTNAIRCKADVFVTSDFKYHQFAGAEQDILVADIGHFESEQFTKEIFHEVLMKKFPNFATHFSKVKTNPINYL
ncbi:MAG: Nif3-like dinuclear metal center hexameric protein [Bacteroidales bacterium]|jgi:dinuclear metal center YbgI/SA1388 family protein|nr:Nif3-like dinuclear metal center hexameric protein [Bacteroidales bacterium]